MNQYQIHLTLPSYFNVKHIETDICTCSMLRVNSQVPTSNFMHEYISRGKPGSKLNDSEILPTAFIFV